MITQYDMVIISDTVEGLYYAAGPDTVKSNGLESFIDFCRQAIVDDNKISKRVTANEMKKVIRETAKELMEDN